MIEAFRLVALAALAVASLAYGISRAPTCATADHSVWRPAGRC